MHPRIDTADPDVPDGKIIGLQAAGTRWVNPNSCAQAALAAEQEQLDSTHPRPVGASGGSCGSPPCEGSTDGGAGAEGGDERLTVDWEDCRTVTIDGRASKIDTVVCHYIQCFPRGPCPTAESVSIEYEPPLTLDGRHLPGGTAPFYVVVIELKGDSMTDVVRVPNPMDCGF